MNDKALIDRLAAGASRIRPLVEGITLEDARWRPAPGKWSILELLGHLVDEEREDFRARLELMLTQPGVLGPPIDPEGWVRERGHNQRDLQELLHAFEEERARSVAWLRDLATPAWGNIYEHPAFGTLHAGDILAAWVAHDLLHIRQLTHLHWQLLRGLAEPYGVGYAGKW
jgi:hypothetical protein